MHSVYHFYLVNQPNFVFIIFEISCSCALYSLHLECNLSPHLVIKIIIYIVFRRYILISMIPILTNTNNTIKFTSRYSLITSPSTAIPEILHTHCSKKSLFNSSCIGRISTKCDQVNCCDNVATFSKSGNS